MLRQDAKILNQNVKSRDSMSKGNNKWNCGRAFTVHCSLHRQRFICKTLQQSTRVDMPRFYDLLTVNSKVEMILTSSVATGPAWASSKGLLSVLASLSPPRSPLVWNQIFWKVRLPSFLINHPWNSLSCTSKSGIAAIIITFLLFLSFPWRLDRNLSSLIQDDRKAAYFGHPPIPLLLSL